MRKKYESWSRVSERFLVKEAVWLSALVLDEEINLTQFCEINSQANQIITNLVDTELYEN